MQHDAQRQALAGEHRGHRGVAAEADHHVAAQRLEQAARLEHAEAELERALELAKRAASGQGAGADAVGFDLRQVGTEPAAAPVGDERHLEPAAEQFPGQRLGREHVPAGAPGGQDDTPRRRAPERFPAHGVSPAPTRRRVSASTMPMASARPIVDEPP